MSGNPYYQRCASCVNRAVKITTRDGRIHRGIITNVNRSHVYLRPIGPRNIGGFGYGFRGGYGGYGYGGGWGIALAAIAGLALLSFFFW